MEVVEAGNYFKAISLNHVGAPIEIREQLTFSDSETRNFLIHLKDVFGVKEAILLSTCNRTEVYWNHSTISDELIIKALASFKGLSSESLASFFQFFSEPLETAQHLFRVGIGLESQVLGDFQIISQVKQAYQACADMQMAGPLLHRLLHSIFFANKKVVQETCFRSGAASVSYAVKELIEDLVSDKSTSILLLGLGEIGSATLKNLVEAGFANLSVCNRSFEKAESFVRDLGVKVVPYEDWHSAVQNSPVVISALSGNVLTIDSKHVNISSRFQYFIDLGLPRSINPEIEQLPGVILYNLDQIQNKVSEALQSRRDSIPKVESIVSEALEEFKEWTSEIQVSPVIHQIKNSLEQIRREEMARFVKKAGEEQQTWADELTKNMMQRIIKNHVVQLKAACKRGEADQLVDVLNQIFNLESKIEG